MNSRNFALLVALTVVGSAFAGTATAVPEATPRRVATLTAPMLFSVLDLDRDGELSSQEQSFAAITLSALDVDGDGVITSTEMAGPVRTRSSRGEPSAVVQTVAYRPVSDLTLLVQIDANHDGRIQPLELANAASSLRELDSNRDGVLTRSEVLPRVQA